MEYRGEHRDSLSFDHIHVLQWKQSPRNKKMNATSSKVRTNNDGFVIQWNQQRWFDDSCILTSSVLATKTMASVSES